MKRILTLDRKNKRRINFAPNFRCFYIETGLKLRLKLFTSKFLNSHFSIFSVSNTNYNPNEN